MNTLAKSISHRQLQRKFGISLNLSIKIVKQIGIILLGKWSATCNWLESTAKKQICGHISNIFVLKKKKIPIPMKIAGHQFVELQHRKFKWMVALQQRKFIGLNRSALTYKNNDSHCGPLWLSQKETLWPESEPSLSQFDEISNKLVFNYGLFLFFISNTRLYYESIQKWRFTKNTK